MSLTDQERFSYQHHMRTSCYMCLTRQKVQEWIVITNGVNLVPLLQCSTWLCTSGIPNQLHILVISICTHAKPKFNFMFNVTQELLTFDSAVQCLEKVPFLFTVLLQYQLHHTTNWKGCCTFLCHTVCWYVCVKSRRYSCWCNEM